MIDNDQITALAREYAEFAGYKDNIDALVVIENAFGWLSQRYCLVEKSKFQELEIARRVKVNGHVALKRSDVDYLFP